jgi:death-on-curing protein
MIRYVTLDEVLELHRLTIERSGGGSGIRDLGLVQSAVAQPGGQDLYPTLTEKAAALCFSLVMNHPFVDGNKRVGHAAMEVFLVLNGYEILSDTDEQEQTILALAAGQLRREDFTKWVQEHVEPRTLN